MGDIVNFSGKVAFVTGSSRGVGREVVMKLASYGCDVVVHWCNSYDKATEVVSEIKELYDCDVMMVQGDVSCQDDVSRMVSEVIDHYGKIDILVNNAGICFDQEFLEKDVDTFRRVLDVNLVGPFLVSQAFAPYLIDSHGVILNVSSTNGIDTYYPMSMDYDASKAGLISLTHNLASYFAPFVRVNAVALGWVDTDMNMDMDPVFRKCEESKIMLGRFASPLEAASVIVFLASDQASYINNSVIRVDGGVKGGDFYVS